MSQFITIQSHIPEIRGELCPELVERVTHHTAPFTYTNAYHQCEFSYTEEARRARRYIQSSPDILEITKMVSKIYKRPRTKIDTRLGSFNSRCEHLLATVPHIDNDYNPSIGYIPMRTQICVVGEPTIVYIGDFEFDTHTESSS